jgi:hypothetical protein
LVVLLVALIGMPENVTFGKERLPTLRSYVSSAH